MMEYTLKWVNSVKIEIVAAGDVFEMGASANQSCFVWVVDEFFSLSIQT